MNRHRKEQAQQIALGASLALGIVCSGLIGCVLWVLAVMYL